MAGTDKFTVNSLLEQTIEALTTSDASRLRNLLRIAEGIQARQQPQMRPDGSEIRLLSCLLAETSRNLRLLKRVRGQADTVNSQLWQRRTLLQDGKTEEQAEWLH